MKYDTVKLGDIAWINSESYSSKENWKFVNYLDTGNITENMVSEIQHIEIGEEKLPSRARRKVKHNSIIYSTVRPNQKHYGIIKEQPENFLVSSGFAVIDIDTDKANADYVYFVLTQVSVIEYLHAIAEQSTSAYPSIKPSDLKNIEIPLPSLEYQKRIASILVALNRKIDINTRINNNLLQQTNSLFANYYEQTSHEVGFTDIIQILVGGTPKTDENLYWNGKIPFFTPKDVGLPYTLTTEKSITEDGLVHCNSRLYPANTVFVTARGTVG